MSEVMSSKKIELMTKTEKSLQLEQYIPINKAGLIHGVAGWFSVTLSDGITISTAPNKPATHWKPVIFLFRDRLRVIVVEGKSE